MTASPEWWKSASSEQQAEFFDRSRKWLADKYGARKTSSWPASTGTKPART